MWAPWKNPKTDEWEKTFATFTSEPNALIEKIHIRQPIVIEPRDFEEWLRPPRVRQSICSVSCPRMA
jgi:putative SOS response-associated peptidase YedK